MHNALDTSRFVDLCVSPLKPGVFPKKPIFKTFLINQNQIWNAERVLAFHFSSMRKSQSFGAINHPTTLGFSFLSLFLLSSFLFFLFFCCSCWPSTRLLLSSRISKKALTRQEILAMDKQRVKRGNFPLSFLPKLQNVLVQISSYINPIGLVWILLERSCRTQ